MIMFSKEAAWLNSDLVKIEEWVCANRVEFTARKTESVPGQNVCMGGTVIVKSDTVDVLGTSIRSELRWDDHVFNVSKEAAKCLDFRKRCKKCFSPSNLLTINVAYITPKIEYNSHLWAGASKSTLDFADGIQSQALKLIEYDRVDSSIISLGHRRNFSCIVLFYKYYFGKYSLGLSKLKP